VLAQGVGQLPLEVRPSRVVASGPVALGISLGPCGIALLGQRLDGAAVFLLPGVALPAETIVCVMKRPQLLSHGVAAPGRGLGLLVGPLEGGGKLVALGLVRALGVLAGGGLLGVPLLQAIALGSKLIGQAARGLELGTDPFRLPAESLLVSLGLVASGLELRATPALGLDLLPQRVLNLYVVLPVLIERGLEFTELDRQFVPVLDRCDDVGSRLGQLLDKLVALGRGCVGLAAQVLVFGPEPVGLVAKRVAILFKLAPVGLLRLLPAVRGITLLP
jgi:hypothetical protein